MKDLVPGIETEGLRPDELSFLADLGEAPAVEDTTPDEVVDEIEPTVTDEEATAEETEDDTPEESDDELDAESTEEEESEVEEAIEYVETSDGKKVKIDYNDRDRVKRAHLLARQGRVWQNERDKARKELEAIKPEFDDIKSVLDGLEAAKDDPAELYRLVTGGQDWEELIEKEIQQREEIAQLTPQQLEVYNKHRLAEKREAELAKREEAWQAKLDEAEQTKQEAEKNTQRAMISSSFNEHRFSGTLGDPVREHKLDKLVFNNIKAELDGKDLGEFEVKELIKREFDDLRASVAIASKKAAKKNKETKIAKATNKAAKGVNKSSNEMDSVRKKIAEGDINSILSMDNWTDLVNKL